MASFNSAQTKIEIYLDEFNHDIVKKIVFYRDLNSKPETLDENDEYFKGVFKKSKLLTTRINQLLHMKKEHEHGFI